MKIDGTPVWVRYRMEGKRKMGKPYKAFVMSMRNIGNFGGKEGWFCPLLRKRVTEWVDADGNVLKSKVEECDLQPRGRMWKTKEQAIAGAKRFKQTVKVNESDWERNEKIRSDRNYAKFLERYS